MFKPLTNHIKDMCYVLFWDKENSASISKIGKLIVKGELVHLFPKQWRSSAHRPLRGPSLNSHPRSIINADSQPASTPHIMRSQSCRMVRAA